MNTQWLILDPAYQRNVVWSMDRMTRLVNSLMSNYYVPPLIFNVKQVETDRGAMKQSTFHRCPTLRPQTAMRFNAPIDEQDC